MKYFKKILTIALSAMMALSLVACGGSSSSSSTASSSGETVDLSDYDFSGTKIGVIRTDATSDEALSWEAYFNYIAEKLGFEIEFTTTSDSAGEVSAINTYASKVFNAVLSFSSYDVVSQMDACESAGMYLVAPTAHPTADVIEELNTYEYYLGGVGPDNDTEYEAGYNLAKYFIDQGYTNFAMFGGAIIYASEMHIYRGAGMLAALCEDASTDYMGLTDGQEIAAQLTSDAMVYIDQFNSDTYKMLAYVSGFDFGDDAYMTSLANMFNADGLEAVLCVGAGDSMASVAAGMAADKDFKIGAVDALTEAYADCFNMGKYTYDCGKFISMVGPGLALALRACAGAKLTDADGTAPQFSQGYWVATSVDELEEYISVDNADSYIYDEGVIRHYLSADYDEFKEWTENNTFENAQSAKASYGAE